jgi:hypothetical protein
MVILFLRGPHVPLKTWFGYKGGMLPMLSADLTVDEDAEKATIEVETAPKAEKN